MSFNISEYKYLIQPGYLFITEKTTSIYGVTGSAVFVSLYDMKRKYSGCCAYSYPRPAHTNDLSTQYGTVAIKHLIRNMKNKGSRINDLKAHLIGGSDIESSQNYGRLNVEIANVVLQYFMIEILSSDTGGKMGRRFIYDTESGQSLTLKTEKIRSSDWFPYTKREDKE